MTTTPAAVRSGPPERSSRRSRAPGEPRRSRAPGTPGRPPTPPRPRATRPSVSIIIPAYDEEASIGRCLVAAVHQDPPAHEIIVVDNRSTDRTAAIVHRIAARYPAAGIRLVRQDEVQGLIPTRNAGFAAATGDVYGRIDADSVLTPGWVGQVAETMTASAIGAVTGPVSYYDVALLRASRISDDVVRRAVRGLGRQYPFLYGSNMAIRASAWDRIRAEACLDPEDLLHEDIDLAVHLFQAGIEAAYAPAMRAGVSIRRLNDSPRAFRDYTRRFERTYQRHDVRHWYLKAPPVILQSIYWPVRLGRTVLLPQPAAA